MNSSIYKEFGKLIVSKRTQMGLSQAEISQILNMPKSTYGNYERGTRKIPLSEMMKICEFLKIDMDAFVNEHKSVETEQSWWEREFKNIVFTEEEIEEITTYARYILSKRDGKK